MISIPNIVIPRLGAEAVQKTLQDMKDGNEDQFQEERERLVDFYCAQQTDKDEYLKTYFNIESDPVKYADYPHNLILSQLNMTAKLIDKKAKNYITQPIRRIDGAVNEVYNDLLLDGGIKTSSKLIDRFTWLLGDHCVVVIADAQTKKLRFDNPYYYKPVFAQGDIFNPIGVMYPVGEMRNAQGEIVQAWIYWDAQTQVILEEGTWNIIPQADNPGNLNPHGVFNAMFTHRMKPFRSHWTRDASDLVDTNRDINVAITSINNAIRYVGFPILAAMGIDENQSAGAGDTEKDVMAEKKRAVKIRFDKILYVTAGADGNHVSLQFLQPNVDWTGLIAMIKSRIEMLATTWNVDIRWDLGGNLASGVALKILGIDNRDELEEVKELYEEYFEVPLFEKLKVISTKIKWIKPVTGKKITIDWATEEYIESPKDKSARLASEFQMNLSNPIDELKKENPDLSDEEALRAYIRNARINKILKQQQISQSEALDILLNPSSQDEVDVEALISQITAPAGGVQPSSFASGLETA